MEMERSPKHEALWTFGRCFLPPFTCAIALLFSSFWVPFSLFLLPLDVHVTLMSGGKTEAWPNRIQHNTKETPKDLSRDLKALLQHAVSVFEERRGYSISFSFSLLFLLQAPLPFLYSPLYSLDSCP